MTMTIDNNQQRHHLASLNYDHMPYSSTQFNNPWSTSGSSYSSSVAPFDSISKQVTSRPTTLTMPYASIPATAPSVGANSYTSLPYQSSDILNSSQSSYEQNYTTAPAPSSTYTPTTSSYAPMSAYGQSLAQQQQDQSQRRLSNPQSQVGLAQNSTAFNEALDGAG